MTDDDDDDDPDTLAALNAWCDVEGNGEVARAARDEIVALAHEALLRKQEEDERAEQLRRRREEARAVRASPPPTTRGAQVPTRPASTGSVPPRATAPKVVTAPPRERAAPTPAATTARHANAGPRPKQAPVWKAPARSPSPPRPAPTATKPTPAPVPALTGRDLSAWRAHNGLTQKAAADRLGVSQAAVSTSESRPTTPLWPKLQAALAAVLRR